jgi:hypothetical protein
MALDDRRRAFSKASLFSLPQQRHVTCPRLGLTSKAARRKQRLKRSLSFQPQGRTGPFQSIDGVDGVSAVRVNSKPQAQLPQRFEVKGHHSARVRLCRRALLHMSIEYLLVQQESHERGESGVGKGGKGWERVMEKGEAQSGHVTRKRTEGAWGSRGVCEK